MSWTEKSIDILRDMWATGQFSASQIAVYLGLGIEGRNAVIGKIHRLGLGRRSAAEIHRLSIARREIDTFEKIRAMAERQRAMAERRTARASQTLAQRRERAMAEGRAIIAKVEAQEEAEARLAGRHTCRPGFDPLDFVDLPLVDDLALPPTKFKLIDNPAFVKVEKSADLYAHMRTDRSYQDAIAALSR